MSFDGVIRPVRFDETDAAAVAAVRRDVVPYTVQSPAGLLRSWRRTPARARNLQLVAELDGAVVATGRAVLNFASADGSGALSVEVRPDFRGRGIGAAILGRAEAHLRAAGANRARTFAQENSLPWIRRRGYEPSRSVAYSRVDPLRLPPMPAIPPGVSLVSLADLGPEAAYVLDMAVTADEPDDVPFATVPEEEWLALTWENPEVLRAESVVALVDGLPAALSVLSADLPTGRGWTNITGTLREYRGRGLAKLVKSAALRRGAAAGITTAYTSNESTNAPMLAVNAWLGYTITATPWSCLRTL